MTTDLIQFILIAILFLLNLLHWMTSNSQFRIAAGQLEINRLTQQQIQRLSNRKQL